MKKIMIICFAVLLIASTSASGCLDNNKKTEEFVGDRIWEEGMPTTYTWNARSFSGFYYDLNTGQTNEYMTITNIGRVINTGDIHYQTTTSDISFEYNEWGTYRGISFTGDKYFTGPDSNNLMETRHLSKVLIDDSENGYDRIYFSGQYIALEEGYSVKIDQIDTNRNSATLILEKNGEAIKSGVVNNSSPTFIYEKNIDEKTIPTVMIYVNGIYAGTEKNVISIGGIFQTSENLIKLENGTKIESMTIRSINEHTIKMTNHEIISLNKGSKVNLMAEIKFLVSDSDTLRFMPAIEYTESGTYEIHGAVSDFSNPEYIVNEWTLQNFEGIYYNINNEIAESESININANLSNTLRIINANQMNYTANTTTVSYEYSGWGNYTVIDFMGERYYAGVNGGLLDKNNVSKVLTDTVEKRVVYLKQSFALEEGISARVDQFDVDGTKVLIVFEKDGKEIGSGIGKVGESLNYTVRRAGSESEIFIRIQIDSIYTDSENSLVTISGIFQASENVTTIKKDEYYGIMRVKECNHNGIILENAGEIILSPGAHVEFLTNGNTTMYFKVGDNETLRYAPVIEYEIV